MKIESKALVDEFVKEFGDLFPDVKEDQYLDILYGPWRFLKDSMEKGELVNVRFKYLCLFTVHEGRKKYLKETLDERLSKGLITQEKYIEIKEVFKKDEARINNKNGL